jgi:hypothetical protein
MSISYVKLKHFLLGQEARNLSVYLGKKAEAEHEGKDEDNVPHHIEGSHHHRAAGWMLSLNTSMVPVIQYRIFSTSKPNSRSSILSIYAGLASYLEWLSTL